MDKNTQTQVFSLYEIISQSSNSDLRINILKFLKRISNSDRVSYLIFDGRGENLLVAESIPVRKKIRLKVSDGIVGYACSTRTNIYVSNVKTDIKYKDIYLPYDKRVRTEYAIPLIVENKVFGILDFQSYREDGFDESTRLNIKMLSYQALIALKNNEISRKINKDNTGLKRLARLLFSIYDIDYKNTNIDVVLQRRLKAIIKIIPYRYISLWMINDDQVLDDLMFKESLSLVGFCSSNNERVDPIRYIKLEDALFRTAIYTKKITYFKNLLSDESFKKIKIVKDLRLRQLICVPLLNTKKNKIIGLLNLYFATNMSIDAQLLELTARQIVTAIDRVSSSQMEFIFSKLIEYPRKTLEQHLQDAIDVITKYGSEAVSIFFMDDYNDILRLKSTTGIKNCNSPNSVFYELGQGLTGRIAKCKSAIVINNMKEKSVKDIHIGKWYERTLTGSQTFLGYPILSKDKQVLGLIRCVNKQSSVYTGRIESYSRIDLNLISAVAKILALYIQTYQINKVQEDLLARIPHDLQNPIVGIRNSADNLIKYRNRDNYQVDQKLYDIIDDCNLLFMIVDRVNYSRKGHNPTYTRIKSEVIIKLVKKLRPMAMIFKVRLNHPVLDHLPNTLYIDKSQIEILIYDLIVNAIKYSYENTDIQIYSKSNQEFFLISFLNFGIGIKHEYLTAIFKPGFRTPEAKKRDVTGTGWGLAIGQEIAKIHGGKIKVSHSHTPTIITLMLPRHLEGKD